MRNLLFSIFIIFSFYISNTTFSQVPQGIKYQAVVRNVQGNIIANNDIGIKISLISNSINGNIEYQEVHNIVTNDFGLVNIVIGQGNLLLGNFEQIIWDNNMFCKVELDIENTGNFVELGTSQILSVPYALNSNKSKYSTYSDTAYYAYNESISNDKQIRFEFGPTNTYGITNTNGNMLDKASQTIIKFNKDNYSNVGSIVFGASIYVTNSSSNCIVELWDVTNNVLIPNSTILTNSTNEVYIESQNILQNISSGDINLAVKIKSDVDDSGVWISKAYLFIKRSELIDNPSNSLK